MLRSLGLVGLAIAGAVGGVVVGGVFGLVLAAGTDPGDWVLDIGEPTVARGERLTASVQRRQVRTHGRVDERALLTVQVEGKPEVGLEWQADAPGTLTVDDGVVVWTLPGGREARVGWE